MTDPHPVDMLLMHQHHRPLSPDLIVLRHPERSTYGVAVVVDGWYVEESDAEAAVSFWRSCLDDVRHDMQRRSVQRYERQAQR